MQLRVGNTERRPAVRQVLVWCMFLVVACSAAGIFLAVPGQALPAEMSNAEHWSNAATWTPTGAILVHGGSYSVLLKDVRWKPTDAAPEPHMLVADLVFSNQSPSVIAIERSSRIHAQVCYQAGACSEQAVAAPRTLMPGEARELIVDLGSAYTHGRLSVLFSDGGGNVLGRADLLPGNSAD